MLIRVCFDFFRQRISNFSAIDNKSRRMRIKIDCFVCFDIYRLEVKITTALTALNKGSHLSQFTCLLLTYCDELLTNLKLGIEQFFAVALAHELLMMIKEFCVRQTLYA